MAGEMESLCYSVHPSAWGDTELPKLKERYERLAKRGPEEEGLEDFAIGWVVPSGKVAA